MTDLLAVLAETSRLIDVLGMATAGLDERQAGAIRELADTLQSKLEEAISKAEAMQRTGVGSPRA